uniref:Thioredoxin-like fold domain-containing protein n=1 Tax=Ditylenchus dipsaci TaxID=166011 RepID=A0A915DAJ0_9BILA
MADIPYQNVDNEFKYKSLKGQIPFVELNGRQIADTNIIIDELTKIFHIQMDDQLVEPSVYAQAYAIHSLIEDTLRWYCIYYRALNNTFFGTEDGLMDQCKAQGVGRLTPSEVDTFARKHLKALSVLLGDKNYLMGRCHGFWTPLHVLLLSTEQGHQNFIESDCRNVVDYLRNIKEVFIGFINH